MLFLLNLLISPKITSLFNPFLARLGVLPQTSVQISLQAVSPPLIGIWCLGHGLGSHVPVLEVFFPWFIDYWEGLNPSL